MPSFTISFLFFGTQFGFIQPYRKMQYRSSRKVERVGKLKMKHIMKTITLLWAGLLFSGNFAAHATTITERRPYDNHVNYDNVEPVEFMERGIRFFVFADGQFDFSTEQSTGSDVYYRNGRRNVNTTYGAPGTNSAGGVKIEHDYKGRVRRVGNVFINYDANDRIKRIGSVYVSYNRYALAQVGGLRIMYNNRGEITGFSGSVNGNPYYNSPTYYGPAQGNHGQYNGNDNNTDDYYYRKGNTATEK